ARAAELGLLALLHRPADLCRGSRDRDRDRRCHRVSHAACRPVPGGGAAHDRGWRELPRRERRGGRRDGGDTPRAGDQRRRGHALHVLAEHERRLARAHHHLRARDRSRHRSGPGTEPRSGSGAAAARGSAAHRRDHAQELAGPAAGRAPALSGRPPRPALPEQLRPAADPRRAGAPCRRPQRHRVRGGRARLDGVGNVSVFGAREYSMRVWLDPERIAELGLTAGDVVAALREQNVQVAAGAVGAAPARPGTAYELPVNTLGRLRDPAQFENIVVHTGEDGRIVRVRDVARVELGALDYGVNAYLNDAEAVGLAISQRPGSNALATAHRVRTAMEQLGRSFPAGLEYRIAYDPTVFVEESVADVQRTLFEAAGLVVLVVLLFLQSWRVSLIPLVAIPVSLIGSFAALAAPGFFLH